MANETTYVTKDGRIFRLAGSEPYIRKFDGATTILLRWSGVCRVCGKDFVVKTPESIDKTKAFGAVHCKDHRRPSRYLGHTAPHEKPH